MCSVFFSLILWVHAVQSRSSYITIAMLIVHGDFRHHAESGSDELRDHLELHTPQLRG
jgi:predicted metalloendopeptidase